MGTFKAGSGGQRPDFQARIDKAKADAKKKRASAKKAIEEDKNFGLTDEELELPPLRNSNSPMNFTDEEIEALTTTDDEESIRLAFGKATPEEKALLNAPSAKGGGK